MLTALVQRLAGLSQAELLELRAETERRAAFEIEQIDSALELRRFQDQRAEGRLRSPRGATRKRVIDAVRGLGTATPTEVIEEMEKTGPAPSGGAVHNMLARLVREGDLARVADGVYALDGLADQPDPGTVVRNS
jgi:hypothetical protein